MISSSYYYAEQKVIYKESRKKSRKIPYLYQETFLRLEKDVFDLAETMKKIASAMDDLSASSSRIFFMMNAKQS